MPMLNLLRLLRVVNWRAKCMPKYLVKHKKHYVHVTHIQIYTYMYVYITIIIYLRHKGSSYEVIETSSNTIKIYIINNNIHFFIKYFLFEFVFNIWSYRLAYLNSYLKIILPSIDYV